MKQFSLENHLLINRSLHGSISIEKVEGEPLNGGTRYNREFVTNASKQRAGERAYLQSVIHMVTGSRGRKARLVAWQIPFRPILCCRSCGNCLAHVHWRGNYWSCEFHDGAPLILPPWPQLRMLVVACPCTLGWLRQPPLWWERVNEPSRVL